MSEIIATPQDKPFQVPKDRRLKTLWNSNGVFVPSGYGIEQRDILYRFLDDGWPVAQIAFSGLEGAMLKVGNLPIYPKMGDTWGSDAMYFHAKHFGAQVVFCMQDIWTLNPQFLNQMLVEGIKWIPYLPIDQSPVPPNILSNLKFAHKIITFSKFGYDELIKAGFVSVLIPEGTDTNIFKPMDKMACRKELGIPQDKFVIGMVGANKENPPRKGWQQALEAFKMFHDNHKDSIFFYQTNQNSPGGFPIKQFAHYLEIDKDVLTLDEYMGTFHAGSDVMVKLYNSFDLLTHASLTEGFGLCAIEAQASGCPIIVNNCQSMPELVIDGVSGHICKTGAKFYSNAGGFYYFPDVDSLHEKMELIYKTDRKEMGVKARKNVVEKFNIDKIVKEKWVPYLEELQKEILGEPPKSIETIISKFAIIDKIKEKT
jgi:glycosyltransferase involved in cell wall biosynthesis